MPKAALRNLSGPEDFSARRARTGKELAEALRALGVIGMWKDRKETKDSAAFAQALRAKAEKREGSFPLSP